MESTQTNLYVVNCFLNFRHKKRESEREFTIPEIFPIELYSVIAEKLLQDQIKKTLETEENPREIIIGS